MIRDRRFILVAVFMLCASPSPVAQKQTMDVSAGYSFVKGDVDGENLHGFVGSFAAYLHWFGLVFEGGANFGKSPRRFGGDLDLVYLSFGPRIAVSRWQTFTPYAQVLVTGITGAGGENVPHSELGTVAAQVGVGADFWLRRRLGSRIGSDYLISPHGSRYNKIRLQLGIVRRF